MVYLSVIPNNVSQHNHFITQGNYKATCFDYGLVILRPIFSIESQNVIHTLGSHRVYIHGINQIKSFVSKGVMYSIDLTRWDTKFCIVSCDKIYKIGLKMTNLQSKHVT